MSTRHWVSVDDGKSMDTQMIILIFNILEQTRAFEIGVVMKKFKIFTLVVVGF